MTDAGLLEVTVLHQRDVAGAQEGGADRLHLTAHTERGGFSPELDTALAVCRESDLPVRVQLRLNDSWTTTGGEVNRLVGLAEDYLGRGAEGVVLGFLDADLEVDVQVCRRVVDSLPGVPWTFHSAVDAVLDPRRSWRRLLELPQLTSVCSAGSPRGVATGCDDLLEACADPAVAALLMPGAGLAAEHVPWLARAGVRQFHLDTQARPGGTEKVDVDAGLVRSWRLLVDDAVERAAG